jgi:hypothetical protein
VLEGAGEYPPDGQDLPGHPAPADHQGGQLDAGHPDSWITRRDEGRLRDLLGILRPPVSQQGTGERGPQPAGDLLACGRS